ncbi:MAG: hypothetical protein HY812_06920 [Planctomycetes bacterium]|nr:hypothetical protein [Planctomycetota bacterium]
MKTRTWTTAAALLAVLCAVAGCIVLSGQRITIFHDQAADRLTFLVEYDGVFDSKEAAEEGAEEKLRAFLTNGDVLLIDWFGHIQRELMEKTAGEPSTPPLRREFLAVLLENLSVKTLGRYRDPEGRVGVAQEVSFEQVSRVLAAANAAISEGILLDESVPPEDWRRTVDRLRAAAKEGRQWLRLEGHSLALAFPVHPAEWARHAREGLLEMFEDWADHNAKEERAAEEADPDWFLRLISSGPVSLLQSMGEVTLRAGDPDGPTTFRVDLREGYRPNLEPQIAALVEADLDRAQAQVLLAQAAENEPPVAVLPSWAPPEDAVRAVLAVLQGVEGEEREAAAAWLAAFAASWNGAEGFPAAPERGADDAAWAAAWAAWYLDVSGR